MANLVTQYGQNVQEAISQEVEQDFKGIKVKGNFACTQISVRKKKGAQQHLINLTIDFGDASRSQLMVWAARSRIITLQECLRDCSDEFLAALSKEGLYKKSMECGLAFDEATQAEKLAKMTKQIGSLSPDAQRTLFEQLKALYGNK